MNPHDRDSLEGEPLLAAEERDTIDLDSGETLPGPNRRDSFHSGDDGKPGPGGLAARFGAQKRTTVLALLALLTFILTTSGMLFFVPIFRLMEDAVCHIHYGKPKSEPIEERLCKVEAVQKELAFLGGVGAVFNSVVSLLTTLPYGVLADR